MSGQRVSVIMPVYNFVTFMEGAIQSVLSQSFDDLEIIVVNDGSGVEESLIIEDICSKDKRLRLINQNNMGQALARCNGIKQATGDYIVFLDADDVLLKDAISYLVDALNRNPQAIAAYGTKQIIRTTPAGRIVEEYIMPPLGAAVSGNILPQLLQGEPLLSNGNICIRREIAQKVIFPQNMQQGEDWVTWCRLALLGDIVYAGDKPVVCVRLHSHNVSGRVFDKPSSLFDMLDVVFKDTNFIAHAGRERITEYYLRHLRRLHMHFYLTYKQRNQYFDKMKHRMLWYFTGWKIARAAAKARAESFRLGPKGSRIRILHVVKWFYAGGGERLVSSLLQHSDRQQYEHIVLSLSDQNERLQDIQHVLQIPYRSFEIHRNKGNLINYLKCFLFIKKVNPDLIKTWLPPSNIAGGKMGKIAGIPVIWGIHDAQPPQAMDAVRQISLSRFLPRRIVCCSQAVYDRCLQLGYQKEKLEIINNGTDTDRFRPQPEGRKKIRHELGIDESTLLIGMAAECIPIKRHSHFLVAAKLLRESYPEAQFLLCGRLVTRDNPNLMKYIQVTGMEQHVHLLGVRNDMEDIYSALDIHTLNSTCESFGLAVTEAMACKTLCVATDVGIIKELLDNVGEVIPVVEDPYILANAWRRIIELPEEEKQLRLEKGRSRIAQFYSITDTARKYDALFYSVYQEFGRKDHSGTGKDSTLTTQQREFSGTS